MTHAEQEPESAAHPAAFDESEQLEQETPTFPTDQMWDSATEQEWSQHSATAWVLAHVIHRIRSTPMPPALSPEQRRHFQKIVQMAAALIEEWQRRERDLAQQLVVGRPVVDLLLEGFEPAIASPEAIQSDSSQQEQEATSFAPLVTRADARETEQDTTTPAQPPTSGKGS